MKELERVCHLARVLAESESISNQPVTMTDPNSDGMERVVCIPQAKVPIVKMWDPELKFTCDMNVNQVLAVENTRMIKTYVQLDERVRPLAMVIKYWTRRRVLNDAGQCTADSLMPFTNVVQHLVEL
jgi:DNA polymerase sigma